MVNSVSLVVKELVEKTRVLIEKDGMQRSMGKAGRVKIEEGTFSVSKRHEKLKKIFDEALGM